MKNIVSPIGGLTAIARDIGSSLKLGDEYIIRIDLCEEKLQSYGVTVKIGRAVASPPVPTPMAIAIAILASY